MLLFADIVSVEHGSLSKIKMIDAFAQRAHTKSGISSGYDACAVKAIRDTFSATGHAHINIA